MIHLGMRARIGSPYPFLHVPEKVTKLKGVGRSYKWDY